MKHKNLRISQIESLEDTKIDFRMSWIKNYLIELNNDHYLKWMKEEYVKYEKSLESHKFKEFLISVAYFGFKLQLDAYQIDQKIIDHFKKFKFRDI